MNITKERLVELANLSGCETDESGRIYVRHADGAIDIGDILAKLSALILAESAQQEPVAWLNNKIPHMVVLTKPSDGGSWYPVFAALNQPASRRAQERIPVTDTYGHVQME